MLKNALNKVCGHRSLARTLSRSFCAKFDHEYNYYADIGFKHVRKDQFHTIGIDAIKQQYSKLVKEYHPDTNREIDHVESAHKLDKLRKAYSVLSNAASKHEYDKYHRAPFQDIPFHSMREKLHNDQDEKRKTQETQWVSYHEKLQDKTYRFNYYAEKHQRGGMKTSKLETNEVEYDNAEVGNVWSNNQQRLNTLAYVLVIGMAIGYVVCDRFDWKVARVSDSFDSTDEAFVRWMNEVNQEEADSSRGDDE